MLSSSFSHLSFFKKLSLTSPWKLSLRILPFVLSLLYSSISPQKALPETPIWPLVNFCCLASPKAMGTRVVS